MKKLILTVWLAITASFLFAADENNINKLNKTKKIYLEVKQTPKEKTEECTATAVDRIILDTNGSAPGGEVDVKSTCTKKAPTCKEAIAAARQCAQKMNEIILQFF